VNLSGKREIEQRLMRRIVDGLAGWVTFHQACNINDHYDEYGFYDAIKKIGRGRGFTVTPQAKLLKSNSKQGRKSTIDFVIYRPAGVSSKYASLIFLEVKYLRGEIPSQDISYLRGDIDKLRLLAPEGLDCVDQIKACGNPSRFLLIVGRGEELDRFNTHSSEKNPGVLEMLKSARSAKLPKLVYRSRAVSYLKPNLRWEVIAIGARRWPK
jgi:hypothetical protein